MAIKRIRFNFGNKNINSNPSFGLLEFYTKINGSWQKYDIGTKTNSLETDKILCKIIY